MSQQCLHVEVEAATLDAAVEEALKQLDCTRAEVDIEVLQVHAKGVLGLFGKKPARVSVKLHDRGIIARQFTRQLLTLSGIDAQAEAASSSQAIEIHLHSDDPSRVIGRHGQALDALQTLVVTMTDRVTTDRTEIVLDVDGYRHRRQDFLQNLARRLSRKVRQSGKPATSPPLPLSERRTLHELLKRETGLETHSKKHDGGRKVVILQKRA
jgi:spoIIIJ-associated protein